MLIQIITIAVLLFAFILVFRRTGLITNRIAALTGALGLGLLAATEIYSFAYFHLMHGDAADITVANYSRNCAYLFFLAAILYLLTEQDKRGRSLCLQIVAGIISVLAIVLIFIGVITGDPQVLYYSALVMMVLCVLSAVFLIVKGNRDARLFAFSVIIVCVLDSIHRLLIIFCHTWYQADIALLFYPVVYLLIGFSLYRLEEEPKADG